MIEAETLTGAARILELEARVGELEKCIDGLQREALSLHQFVEQFGAATQQAISNLTTGLQAQKNVVCDMANFLTRRPPQSSGALPVN